MKITSGFIKNISSVVVEYLRDRPKGLHRNKDDTMLCYRSAISNAICLHDAGYDCTIHLGSFGDEGYISHSWVECKGEILQTRAINKPLTSEFCVEITSDMTDNEIMNRIKYLYAMAMDGAEYV